MTPELGTHVAIATPDARGRVNIRKWAHPPVEQWRVYRENDGKTIILEAIE